MENYDSAAEKKCNRERENVFLHKKAASEPSPGNQLFAEQDVCGPPTDLEGQQRGASGNDSVGSEHKYRPGKTQSSVDSQSSQHNVPCPRVGHHPYPQKLAHSYPQLLMQEPGLSGAVAQLGPETHAWPLTCPSTNEETRSQEVFPQPNSQNSHAVFVQYSRPGSEPHEEIHKKELKPKKTGKYICNYCGRACAKPSVLKKHIRSHTGERPYPCGPCGFSFKTKSNLYKHRKSHAHAIKAGLVPFSEQAATRADMDQASSVGETDIHSDGEQSTDTDEESTECLLFQDNNCQIPQVRFGTESRATKKFGQPVYADSAEEFSVASMKVPILIIPKQGIPSGAMDCANAQICEGDESHTIKQRLALRLTEKNDQEQGSEQSLNLLSPHSKGSTDSGYFSRSESAEQQISPPNTNVKSYEEIMFGRTWYKPSRLKQPISPLGMVAGQDSDIISMNEREAMLDMGIRTVEHGFPKGDSAEMQILPKGEANVHTLDPQASGSLLEPPSDSGPLLRSNSMPTSSLTNLTVPPNLRGSHSFDEMITQDDVFYPGAAGLRRLRRQAAFEHSAHEGHADSENSIMLPKTTIQPSKFWDRGHVIQDFRTLGKDSVIPERERHPFVPTSYVGGTSEGATRKRRIEKSVGDEEDSGGQDEGSESGVAEIADDYDPNMGHDAPRGTSTERAIFYSQSQSDSLDNGNHPSSEDLVFVPDPDRKTTGNVISVIQHTNSLSRPNSFDKSESIDLNPCCQDKPSRKLLEHSDVDFEDGKSPEFILRSESMDQHQHSDHERSGISANQQYHVPHKLVRQPNIQVPEIRVTEEPEKADREAEAATAKEPEKPPVVEEFQWPQRSETLSQLPAEKLPPKKKRLRLADMEYSSGESSFESTCTSLSRSPSQDSNLSHSSSFSMSFDREESLKCMSPTKLDDLCKQSDFLTVPGHTLSLPGHHHKEMRRSSSEQAPCTLPADLPENRSKSFDYGSLSPASKQGELYISPSSSKQQRRGYLVRQASLSVYPETVVQEQNVDSSMKKEHADIVSASTLGWQGSSQTACHGSTTGEEPKSKKLQGCEHFTKESTHQEAVHHSLPNTRQNWDNCPPQKQVQYASYSTHDLPTMHIRHPGLLPDQRQFSQTLHLDQSDEDRGNSQSYCQPLHRYSHSPHSTPTRSSATLPGISDSSFQGMLVPVRIPTHVPSYSSVMYTSVSDILPTHAQCTTPRVISIEKTLPMSLAGMASKRESGLHLTQSFGHPDACPVWKIPKEMSGVLNTGIPLSLTSGTVTTTDSSSAIGASKRMLSPANSIELFIDTKQQKLVKEERMYGQIVKELSAVELSNTGPSKSKSVCLSKNDAAEQEKLPSACKIPITKAPTKLTALQQRVEALTPPLPILPDNQNRTVSLDQLDADGPVSDPHCFQMMSTSRDTPGERMQDMSSKPPMNQMLVQLVASQAGGRSGCTFLLTDLSDKQQLSQFPTLRTTTGVSWCFLNYTKPNHSQTTPISSVYGSWSVSSYNPNPFSLSTKATLALLCSRQTKNTETYTTAAMHQPGSGRLVSSLLWKQRVRPIPCVQPKTEIMQIDSSKYGHHEKSLSPQENENDRGEKEHISKKAEPTRIKIFEGGFKSNEDYVYVRGRGRGKYICEECGIRCKKPSMLKKHIRTHTDVRPYVCKFCNFAFKTKGNLTKHMKSKAHMKKCLELGVSVTSIDGDAEEADAVEGSPRDLGQVGLMDHQFSDAEDSEGAEDDGDDLDEDEEDEEEYEGDSTPRTCSRSTSPQPSSLAALAATVVTASQGCSTTDLMHPGCKPSVYSFLTSQPIIQAAQLRSYDRTGELSPMQEYQNLLHGTMAANYRNQLSVQSSLKDEDFISSPEHISPSSPSCLSSSGYESSPLREPSPTSQRYVSFRRELSPRRHLPNKREPQQHVHQHLSPRKDFSRRDVSPRRSELSLSPTNLLSPISGLSRPSSPGSELGGRRDLSPRSRYKMRPVSPRRGLHHHSASWNQGQNLHAEVVGLVQKARGAPETDMEQTKKLADFGGRNVSSCIGAGASSSSSFSSSHGLFSHLPLHSQLQVRAPFPMFPIGGIQMVQSARPTTTTTTTTTTPGIPTSPSAAHVPLESNAAPGKSSAAAAALQDADGQQLPGDGRRVSHVLQTAGTREERSQPSALTEKLGKRISGQMPSDADGQQEESVQVCTKAIASLRIFSEEPREKSAVHDNPTHTPSDSGNKTCTLTQPYQDSSVK